MSGLVGAYIALLDALVAGYGSKPACGWTKVWSGTNLACYRNSLTSGSGAYLYVDDTNAQWARIFGYESFNTTTGVGTNSFPTATQAPVGGVVWHKSSAASSAARAWFATATENTLWVVNDRAADVVGRQLVGAGDYRSVLLGDTTAAFVYGGNATTNAAMGSELISISTLPAAGGSQNGALYVARAVGGSPGAVYCALTALYAAQTSGGAMGATGVSYPYQGMSGIPLLYKAVMHSDTYSFRGEVPGIVVPVHALPFTDQTSLPSMGPAGQNLLALTVGHSSGSIGLVLLITSGAM